MTGYKRPFTAGALNFLVPGLGLLYLGFKKGALINFALVSMAMLIGTIGIGDPQIMEHVHYLFLSLAALSAGYAHGVATSRARMDGKISHNTDHGVAA